MRRYQITLTEEQLVEIAEACEIVARLGIGQLDDALRRCNKADGGKLDYEDRRYIESYAKKALGIENSANLGIWHPNAEDAALPWNLYVTFRHRLAWDDAIDKGITDGANRDFSKMFSVHYDEPVSRYVGPFDAPDVRSDRGFSKKP